MFSVRNPQRVYVSTQSQFDLSLVKLYATELQVYLLYNSLVSYVRYYVRRYVRIDHRHMRVVYIGV